MKPRVDRHGGFMLVVTFYALYFYIYGRGALFLTPLLDEIIMEIRASFLQ